MADDILLTDRTTIETDWECETKRYWYKEFGGRGLIPVSEEPYFKSGRIIHQAFADIANGKLWQQVIDEMDDGMPPAGAPQQELETFSWLVGMIAAYGMFIHPYQEKSYRHIMIEKELALEYGRLWIACTPDYVDEAIDGRPRIVVGDFKSVGLLGKEWVNHWPYAIQMHINQRAVISELGHNEVQSIDLHVRPVDRDVATENRPCYGLVRGLVKGTQRDGKLRHPYVWAYQTEKGEWLNDWNAKAELRLVLEHPDGVVGWVKHLGPDIASSLFPVSAPIFLDNRLLDNLLAQTERREAQVAEWRKNDGVWNNQVFPQRFKNCRPSFGSACPYLAACHNAQVNRDPIGSKLYVWRQPHHDMELIMKESD